MARRTDRARVVPLPGREAERAHGLTPQYPELLDRLPAIVYVADPGDSGRWHYVSPQIEAILGFSPDEWCADPRMWVEHLHPEDRARVVTYEADHVAGTAGGGPLEYRMVDRDGRIIWIRDDAVLVRDRDGVERWHGVLSNISEQKQAEAELARRAAQQAAVARLGEHALEGASPTELIQEAVTCAASLLGVEISGVLELIRHETCFVLRAGVGWPAGMIGTFRSPLGRGSQAGYTVLSRAPVVVEDWETEERFEQLSTMRELGFRSGASVTIDAPTGPLGVLGVQARTPRGYSTGDLDFLQAVANVLADALERQAVEDRIRHRALHDPLTGLPNRVLFLDRLEHALSRLERRPGLAAILFLDLDRFKLVNDSLGHHVGDELLAAAAPRLKDAVRASDTVARFGGDEFGILLEDIRDERDAIEMAERIAGVFARPFVLAGSEHFVTTSIGIAIARGGELSQELIRDADSAMYRAKERGSARYELFDQAMRDRAIIRLRVENDLRRALERDELRLEYQPVVSLRDRAMVGVEALVRWQHPARGMVPPLDFIPVAEEDGLIEPIGRWVLERACRDAIVWHRQRPHSPLAISVNLSAIQFAKRSLPDVVRAILRASGLDPAALSIEITESVILRDADGVTDALLELKQIGVRLVLDDFGTGYSSLAYLTRLPLDVLKIDRSFVDGLGREPRDTAITEAVIAMSRALSLDVVAEGVESEVQARELLRLGCEFAQGFHFSPAIPASAIGQIVRDGQTVEGAASREQSLTGRRTFPA
jgi:diguanylate cyclase (GGDEF)-like protein/PAS domain S-box-containing protein